MVYMNKRLKDGEDNTEMMGQYRNDQDNTAPGSSTIDKIYIVYFSMRFKEAQWSLITTVHLGDLDIQWSKMCFFWDEP